MFWFTGHRPGRIEPRVCDHRGNQYRLMMQPRMFLNEYLRKGNNSFE
jgi:hypothetical protein